VPLTHHLPAESAFCSVLDSAVVGDCVLVEADSTSRTDFQKFFRKGTFNQETLTRLRQKNVRI
jgi:hypothetical protein